MISIFVSHTQEDAEYAEDIRTGLEECGYYVWRELPSLTLESVLHPSTIENVILGSAAVVLLWSSTAAQAEWVERHVLFAQQLKKLIVPILLDGTALPTTLVAVSPIESQGSCTHVIAQLVPLLPAVKSTDALIALSQRATHEFIRERKAAIEQAAKMLQRDEQREAVLALLEYLAHNDLMDGVRTKAQEVLDADASKAAAAPPSPHSGDSRHTLVVCCKNGHVSYFDKRYVCKASVEVPREFVQRAGRQLDELYLTCDTCGVEVVARVDCGDYR
ncbi:MAG: toll/interleukin-1 receptor domain-containing protein [Ktedonobacteraceae bacterium]|nr:toll/interleukin-1 receptor domain-containing protein [Ktedonobacteraceae bacterium]